MDENLDAAPDQEFGRLIGANVEDVKLGTSWNVLLAAARKVVHNQYPVARFDEGVGHMAADKSRAAGDTNG